MCFSLLDLNMSVKTLFRRRVFELYFGYQSSIALTKINNVTGNHPTFQTVPLPLHCNTIPLPLYIVFHYLSPFLYIALFHISAKINPCFSPRKRLNFKEIFLISQFLNENNLLRYL